MTTLTYHKSEWLMCLHFPMTTTSHFDVASDPFKCDFSALMWLHGARAATFGTQHLSIVNITVLHSQTHVHMSGHTYYASGM